MESPSERSRMFSRDYGLLDVVFSWSLADIFDDNLYKEKVKTIPKSFETVNDYFSSFINPLLEETRADLRSIIETVSGAPYAEVVSCEVKPARSLVHNYSLLYDVKVDEWRNRNVRGKEPYKTLPGDIFAVMNSRPEHDLDMMAQTWVLAHVRKISEEKDDGDERSDGTPLTFFSVELSKDIDVVNNNYNSLFLVHLLNLTTNKRIWNALHMHGNLRIIKGILQTKVMDEDGCGSCCSVNDNCLSENLCIETPTRLNPSQTKAVVSSLQLTQCEHRPQVRLVWGPPGTGKTKILSTLLYLLVNKNCRILACAPTNVAITQVAGCLLELMKNAFSDDSDGVLGKILLIGNSQRLRVGSDNDIEDIYLDYRVNRLAECFRPVTGWRSCFPPLLHFLESCVLEYNIFLENESKVAKQCTNDADRASQIKTFLAFVRDRFKATAEPVRRCIGIFCTHLSKSFIGEHNLENMKSLSDLLDAFETLLLQDDIDSSELLEVFSSSKAEIIVNGLRPLEELRRRCISALRTLYRSLDEMELPTIRYAESMTEESVKRPMMELCFQMASLVFCTASTSSMLYSWPVEPFDILVVDEAAQLKECESAIPLQLPGLRHAVMFGDDCQLPAMVQSNTSSKAGFGRSLFQRLSLLSWPKLLLNMQYRMHPSISAFPNAKFYSNQIEDAPSVRDKCYEKCYLPGPMYGPYSFIHVSEGRDEPDDDGRSVRNVVEAAVVAKILQCLHKSWCRSTEKLSIGIISPYAAQVVAIEEMLGRRYEKLENFVVKVKSVDGFQGGEEDIVIISTVRSNLLGSVGFISNLQRTNVALTRARHCLWILGHEDTLLRSDSIWKTVICDAKERRCFYNADEDKNLAQAMIDVKKQLDHLDDLLNKDSILFKSSRWKVLFSDNFVKTFSKLPSDRTKKSVMNLLVRLSNGWRPKKIKTDPVCESSLHIVKQYKVEGRYVICTNDIINEEGIYSQVLKIWDIVPLEDVAKLVKRLENVYRAFTDDFLTRCKEKCLQGDLEVPRTWNASVDIVRFKSRQSAESATVPEGDLDGIDCVENAKVSESLLLMKFYALSAGTVSHLLSDAEGKELDLPFEVNDEEKRIIRYSKSSFILGRSGTGKTTVLTMKLFQREQLLQMALDGLGESHGDASIVRTDDCGKNEPVLRQLFVTVSPKLCYAIKQHVSQLTSFARSGSSSVESAPIDDDFIDDRDQFKGIPDSFSGIPPNAYPLVVTFTKFLLMLDGTLGPSYFDRFRDEIAPSEGGGSRPRSASLLMKRKEVTYDRFSAIYWPHFNSQLTKKLDASRVFTEIISSIKGGLQVGETDDGKLSMESYLQLSEGRSSTLSWQQREIIYNIFLIYEKMKIERGEFDLADFVNDLHRRLMCERYGGDNIDFVYIDEVQDLTIRQIELFKYICSNVEEGFVFSGDTAQTIARGIDFRFQDVRCLYFREFLMRVRSDGDHESQEKGQISPIFHLSQNFRTHAGILKLGDSVIQLIYHFFPQSIDILPPETSLIFGEAPILLESGSDENAIVTIFGNTGNVGGNLVGFGAEQVILVRDDCVRKEISDYVGKHALVLTIVECKGLEFQDVLLYNFFGSSPLTNQWRVVYEYMKVNNLLDSTLPQSYPDFNPEKHNVLCSELKQLYVAITRTRQRLWICENKENVSKPMFDYWKKKHVVQVRHLDDSLAQAMQVASSPEEWRARGKKLLAVNNYEVATMCFERAGDKHWETFAKAAGLEAAANRAQNHEEALKILRQAGELFESIYEYKRAANCYYESKDYAKAGRIYHQHCGESELERAGECFTLSGLYELAAEVYAKGNFFSECLSSCTKGELFDMGLQYIQFWKHQATSSQCTLEMRKELDAVEQSFLEKCAHTYYEKADKTSMMKFVKAFCSVDSMRDFLRRVHCLDELRVLEEELGNFSRAAQIASEQGDILLEANLLEKGALYKEACDLFLHYAFASSLWANGGNGWPLKRFPQKADLLLKAKNIARCLEPHHLYQTTCTEVLILLNRNHSFCALEELLTISRKQKNKRGEILVTKRILDLLLATDASKYEHESGNFELSQNKISVETLIHFWSSYKETTLPIFKYLESFVYKENGDLIEIGEFIFSYLGLRKLCLGTTTTYVCLYPEAKWLLDVTKRSLQKAGNLYTIDQQNLVYAARCYWSSEFLCTGMKVLRTLEALLNYSNKSFMSLSYKARIIAHVHEVAKFLLSWKYLNPTNQDSKSLQSYIDLSLDVPLNSVFPVNWTNRVCKDMVLFRETDVSSQILKEIIIQNIPEKCQLTYGQLGRVSMVLLGSSKSKTELYEPVLKRCDVNSSWQQFFVAISGPCDSDKSNDNQSHSSLALNLHNVLVELYNANWRNEIDYITPVCFLYLVDRLMVHLMAFQGSLITCRSSLVEFLIHHDWKATHGRDSSIINNRVANVNNIYQFLSHAVHQLIVNKHETLEWVEKSSMNMGEYPTLLLRLVIFMCLLFLNYGMCLSELRDILNTKSITEQLPHKFWGVLRGRKQWLLNVHSIGKALKAIGDPLVIVSSGNGGSIDESMDAICLQMVEQKKEDLLRTLFPENAEFFQDGGKRLDNGLGLQHQRQSEECIELKYGDAWGFFGSLKLVENEDDKSRQRLASFAPKIKDQVDKAYKIMRSSITEMSAKNNSSSEESKYYASKADSLLLELQILSAALDASGGQLRENMLLIKDCFLRLEPERAVFEHFLGPPPPPPPPKETETPVEKAKSTKERNLQEGQKDDSSVADPQGQCSNQDGPKNGKEGNLEENPKDRSLQEGQKNDSPVYPGNQDVNQGSEINEGDQDDADNGEEGDNSYCAENQNEGQGNKKNKGKANKKKPKNKSRGRKKK